LRPRSLQTRLPPVFGMAAERAERTSLAAPPRGKRYEEGFIESRWPQVVGKASQATDSGSGSQAAKAYAETGCCEIYDSPGPLQASREHSPSPHFATCARGQGAGVP